MQLLTPPEKVMLQRRQPCPKGRINVTHRFPYTPIGDSGSWSASSHRSGRHSYESAPHTSGFLNITRVSMGMRLAPGITYMLCPNVEIPIDVPPGTGRELYTFPETPMIGFETGMTSSFQTTREISVTGGWILNVSCTIDQLDSLVGSCRERG